MCMGVLSQEHLGRFAVVLVLLNIFLFSSGIARLRQDKVTSEMLRGVQHVGRHKNPASQLVLL